MVSCTKMADKVFGWFRDLVSHTAESKRCPALGPLGSNGATLQLVLTSPFTEPPEPLWSSPLSS